MSAAVCEAPRCEFGWVPVLESYVEREAPEPDLPEGDGPELEAERAKIIKDWEVRRGGMRNTWYPCKLCNPRTFMRWAGGHLAADHDRSDCEQCENPRGSRRKGGRTLAEPTPPPPVAEQDRF